MRVLLIANPDKDEVVDALNEFRPWLREHATIVGEPADLHENTLQALPEADIAIVLGGDGTLLSAGRSLVGRAIPLLGINFGKLGFLADYDISLLKQHWQMIASGEAPLTHRLLIDVDVFSQGSSKPVFSGIALNDAVVNAGLPFRMVDLELTVTATADVDRPDGQATRFSGDGVVVSTPTGSTAYNLSAGGPILAPDTEAVCVTPLNPQSLAFRPIVYSAAHATWVDVRRANQGTSLVLDGQIQFPLQANMSIRVTRHANVLSVVHNPNVSYWTTLAHKMHWAARPVVR